jgi:hypothetical protein
VFLHEFREHLVFALEFGFEGSELTILGGFVGRAALAGVLEGSGAILEELLLPEIEEVDGEVVFLTDVGDRLLLQEVEAQKADFLL